MIHNMRCCKHKNEHFRKDGSSHCCNHCELHVYTDKLLKRKSYVGGRFFISKGDINRKYGKTLAQWDLASAYPTVLEELKYGQYTIQPDAKEDA